MTNENERGNAMIAQRGTESARINECENVQGEQSIAVQMDMKCWAIKVGMWATAEYGDIVEAHAEARGWKQKPLTGMEVCDE